MVILTMDTVTTEVITEVMVHTEEASADIVQDMQAEGILDVQLVVQ